MNKLLFSALLLCATGCGLQPARHTSASEQDYTLANSVHFDHAVMDELRALTIRKISRLRSPSDKHDALQFDYSNESEITAGEKKTFNEVQTALKKKGYLLFKTEVHAHDGPDKFAVMHSADQMDIIRFRATSGPTYGITNSSLVQKLQEWNKRFGIEITGADADWVELRIAGLPASSASIFAEDLYNYCPDLATNAGSQESLVAQIRDTRKVMLWWE
jgi:hypothetical protein